MGKTFHKINAGDIIDNPFKLIKNDWMLITAGTRNSFNTMTAGWGGMGVLWSRQVVFCFVRPTRYTYKFMEKNGYFTLTFFAEKYRDILNLCGAKSGRDIDKIKETGLKPLETEMGNIYFEQSRLVIECRKIYFDDIKPEHFLESKIHNAYPEKDYHRLYVGEIITSMASE
jgi:flavin reductase (DIM6/NTAB) family NADH-FMN oxidoreductase RutF